MDWDSMSIDELCKPLSARVNSSRPNWSTEPMGLRGDEKTHEKNLKLQSIWHAKHAAQRMRSRFQE